MKIRCLALIALLTPARAYAQTPLGVRADNPLDLVRRDESISIPWAQLKSRGFDAARIRVLDAEGTEIPSQVVDDDGDGTMDALIFQATLGARQSRRFTIQAAAPARYEPRVSVRHDDPRDDMAWESDRIAFRIYGEGLKKTSSAMSSNGIDVWNKKTRALIVEKWYAAGHDAYHVDTGEGADFYDVGETLGNGGTAGWARDTIWRGDNFKAWKVITSGPVRAIFELRYDPWNVNGRMVGEVKRISIDAGANVYKATSVFTSPTPGEIKFVIGTVKRPGMIGIMSSGNEWAWLTGWGPVAPKSGGHGEMGTAVLLPRSSLQDWKEVFGHYLAVSKAQPGIPVVHYIGAGWTDSGDFPTPQSWWKYLDETAQRLAAPVTIAFP